MNKTILFIVFFLNVNTILKAQAKIAATAGAIMSQIVEKNNLPNFSNYENSYSPRIGFHIGLKATIPFKTGSRFFLQPGMGYYQRGRKFDHTETGIDGDTHTVSKLNLNYIDIPLNILYKLNVTKNIALSFGGGPYLSFFLTGKESSVITGPNDFFLSEKNKDLPVGKGPGKYRILNYGINGHLGIEIGKITVTGTYSYGLNDFYQPLAYEGSFRHQTMGATVSMVIATIVLTEKTKKKKEKNNDKDKDGIPDNKDKCPVIAGTAKYNGCPVPDTDRDGINDENDKCPAIAGTVKYNGCPVPDTDGDGINDDDDKCPAIAGLARYFGCAVPDTDQDGTNDEEDRCLTISGKPENKGCPFAVDETLQPDRVSTDSMCYYIRFDPMVAILRTEAYNSLNKIVALLKNDNDLQISISGHSDNVANEATNLKESQERALVVQDYIQSFFIDKTRIKISFWGSQKSIVISKDAKEQWRNRRVEICLYKK